MPKNTLKNIKNLKNAISYLKEQIKLTEDEIAYFEEIQTQIELAEPQDLTDIQVELENGGYLRKNTHHKKNKRRVKINHRKHSGQVMVPESKLVKIIFKMRS